MSDCTHAGDLHDRIETLHAALVEGLPDARIARDVSLAALTTFRVGGPADLLVTVSEEAAAGEVVKRARALGVPVVALGGGSNVLIADRGIRGVVLRFHGGTIAQAGGAPSARPLV